MAKAKKNCEYGDEITNGAKAGVTMFVIGAAVAVMKKLGKPKRRAKKE